MATGMCYCCAGSVENGAVLSGGRVYCSLECARADQRVLAQLARDEASFASRAALDWAPAIPARAPAARLERRSTAAAAGSGRTRAVLTGSR